MSAARSLLANLVGDDGVGCAPPQAVPLRAFAWARVSTDMQGERGDSIPEQLRQIRAYAEQHGIEVVGEFSEVASAFQKEERRVEFHRMLAQAKADAGINAILVHDFSRFSRDSLLARTLIRDLRKVGIKVISATDPRTDTGSATDVYVEAFVHAKNEAYSRDIAFHTRKGCQANAQTRDPGTNWCYTNGGQPLWGYRMEQLQRGLDKRGRPIIKSIWALDDTVVAGRLTHEWIRHCLVEMAARGASLNELRDFCEETRLPARRKAHWGCSTWNALLQPHVLLKYCGHGVWNVHTKTGAIRPSSEWVIVENAHPAIISPEEAQAIVEARRQRTRQVFFQPGGRSRSSPYLLTGGLFKCGRCGANMTGLKVVGGTYYVCGSLPYRRGRGCGTGVYVPVDLAEREAIAGLKGLVGHCSDPRGFTRRVNEEIARLWQASARREPVAEGKVEEVDAKIVNIRKAIEDGLADASWANSRLRELSADRQRLTRAVTPVGKPPQITVDEAMTYRRDVERLFQHGTMAERKQLMRAWVADMKLAPERREIEITYRVPEPFMNKLVAGAGFEPATFGL